MGSANDRRRYNAHTQNDSCVSFQIVECVRKYAQGFVAFCSTVVMLLPGGFMRIILLGSLTGARGVREDCPGVSKFK